jgi:hypothetical protein
MELKWRGHESEYGWETQSSTPRHEEGLFFPLKLPDGLWGPPSILFMGKVLYFPGDKAAGA